MVLHNAIPLRFKVKQLKTMYHVPSERIRSTMFPLKESECNTSSMKESDLTRFLWKNQIHHVPFERNSERVKEVCAAPAALCKWLHPFRLWTPGCLWCVVPHKIDDCRRLCDVVLFQRYIEIYANPIPHIIIFIDEAGFNLTKIRWRKGLNMPVPEVSVKVGI